MAHGLGLKVVAEGVETQEQLDKLIVLGCDYAQGYLLGHPSPATEIDEMLASHYGDHNPGIRSVS